MPQGQFIELPNFFNPHIKPVNETLLLFPFEDKEGDLFK